MLYIVLKAQELNKTKNLSAFLFLFNKPTPIALPNTPSRMAGSSRAWPIYLKALSIYPFKNTALEAWNPMLPLFSFLLI